MDESPLMTYGGVDEYDCTVRNILIGILVVYLLLFHTSIMDCIKPSCESFSVSGITASAKNTINEIKKNIV